MSGSGRAGARRAERLVRARGREATALQAGGRHQERSQRGGGIRAETHRCSGSAPEWCLGEEVSRAVGGAGGSSLCKGPGAGAGPGLACLA